MTVLHDTALPSYKDNQKKIWETIPTKLQMKVKHYLCLVCTVPMLWHLRKHLPVIVGGDRKHLAFLRQALFRIVTSQRCETTLRPLELSHNGIKLIRKRSMYKLKK